MKVEVRCCCMASKLLGWLETYITERESVQEVTFVAVDCVRIDNIENGPAFMYTDRLITLPMATVQHPDGRRYKAFKSEETPIEVLRRIPGFTENK